MYAIVEIAGQQFKVEKDRKVYVHRLTAEEGAQVEFDKVLLVDNEGDIKIGTPVVEGAKVTAKVLSHVKADKVIVFKNYSLEVRHPIRYFLYCCIHNCSLFNVENKNSLFSFMWQLKQGR